MYKYNCLNCDQEFETEIILQHFCCHTCTKEWWDQNYNMKIIVTTPCIKCKKDYTREKFIWVINGFIGLECCLECDPGKNMVLIGNNKRYD